jgi:hypothetical protein
MLHGLRAAQAPRAETLCSSPLVDFPMFASLGTVTGKDDIAAKKPTVASI